MSGVARFAEKLPFSELDRIDFSPLKYPLPLTLITQESHLSSADDVLFPSA